MKRIALAAALLLSACNAAPNSLAYPDTGLALPPRAGVGPYQPAANAITGAAAAFRDPAALAGRPAEAAVAVIQLEWLAATVPRDLMFSNYSTITGPALQAARSEVRATLGIAPGAPPAAVIAGLDGAAASLTAGDAAGAERALSPPAFAPGTLARLSRMPYLPGVNNATRRAQRDLEFGRDDDLLFSRR